MRRFAVTSMVLTLTLALLAPSARAATPDCGIEWGSKAKTLEKMRVAPLVDVRAGQHRCFDRLVFDIDGRAPGYRVRYVKAVEAQGSGEEIPLRGGADIEVTVLAPAHDQDGKATYEFVNPRRLVRVRDFRTFRQVAWGGSFEGQTTVGLGVRARLPFRVFRLTGPGSGSRLVIDVAHRW